MAITVVASGTVEYPSGGTSITFTLPLNSGAGAGLAVGDVIVFNVTCNVRNNPTITPPAGSTTVAPMLSAPSGWNGSGGTYVWPVPDPKPASVTFTWGVAQRGTLAWVALRGVDPVSPVNRSATIPWSDLEGGLTLKEVPSVTTTVADAFVVAGLMQASGSAAITPPAGWTQRTNAEQRDGHISTRDTLQVTPGATGEAWFGVEAGHSHYRWTVALAPAGDSPPPADTGDITVEGVYSASNAANLNVASLTVTGVVVPADAVMVAAVAFNNDNEETVANVRLNNSAGTPFTRIGSDAITVDDGNVGMWIMQTPTAGTHTVTANLSTALATGDDLFTVGVWVLTGVNSDTPFRNTGGVLATQASTATPTITTTTVPGDLMLGAVFAEANIYESRGLAPAAGTNVSWRQDGSGFHGDTGMGVWKLATDTTTDVGWTITAGETLAGRAVPFIPAESTPPAEPIVATLMTQPYPGASGDVADGAAIVDPAAAPGGPFIITTRKETGGGLYVLDIDGQILSSNLDGAANSVDWRDTTGLSGWDDRLLVLGVDRTSNLIRYYWMNRTTGALTAAGSTSLAYEPYGSCLYVHSNGSIYAFISDRGVDDFGTHYVRQYLLTRSGSTVSAGSPVRTISADGVMEGMAADDQTGVIFVSREDHGLYRYPAAPAGSTTPTTVDTVGAGNLVADVEDVAIARQPDGPKLLVSSQGDSSYHVYDMGTLAHEQRFTVARPGGTPLVTGTDGLDVLLTPMPGFPDGLIVVHDEAPNPSRFAFVDAGPVFGELPLPFFVGSEPVTAIYVGSEPVTAIYRGSTLVWEA